MSDNKNRYSQRFWMQLIAAVIILLSLILYILVEVKAIKIPVKNSFWLLPFFIMTGLGVYAFVAGIILKYRPSFFYAGVLLMLSWIYASIAILALKWALVAAGAFIFIIIAIMGLILALKAVPPLEADNEKPDYKDYKERQAEKEAKAAEEKQQEEEIKIKSFKD